MNLSTKIARLRHARGWSQEELAERLGVSRQSVSKWESGASTPDLERVAAMCRLFGLSADALIRPDVDLDEAEPAAREADARGAFPELPLTEAYNYSARCQTAARQIARGVAACVFAVAPLIVLDSLGEVLGEAVGLPAMLLTIAWAVWQFVCADAQMKPFERIEKRSFSPGPGVEQWAREAQEQFRPRLAREQAAGIAMCVASAAPVSIGGALAEASATAPGAAFLESAGVAGMLGLIAAGVYWIVRSGILMDSYKKLLGKRR